MCVPFLTQKMVTNMINRRQQLESNCSSVELDFNSHFLHSIFKCKKQKWTLHIQIRKWIYRRKKKQFFKKKKNVHNENDPKCENIRMVLRMKCTHQNGCFQWKPQMKLRMELSVDSLFNVCNTRSILCSYVNSKQTSKIDIWYQYQMRFQPNFIQIKSECDVWCGGGVSVWLNRYSVWKLWSTTVKICIHIHEWRTSVCVCVIVNQFNGFFFVYWKSRWIQIYLSELLRI